nr:hypothetical protein [Tanacetum cinerariifolium]
MPKDKKPNLKCTARISVRPYCFSNPRTLSPPYNALSSCTNYQSAPSSTLNVSPPFSPLITQGVSPSKILLTSKSSPPPLTSPPSALTQPFKHSSPLAINIDLVKLLFITPPSSPQTFFDSLEDLPPKTTNPPPPRPSYDTIEHLANEPPPLPTMNTSSTFAPTTPYIFLKSHLKFPATFSIKTKRSFSFANS